MVGVIVTEILSVKVTSALSACAVSLDDVQARAQMCVWVASVHVKDTASPVVALAVHTVAAPETLAVTVVAEPEAAHVGELETAVVPER